MTVQSTTLAVTYSGNGISTAFAVNFNFADATWLVVTLRDAAGVETIKVLNTDYTVTGAGSGAGGTVNFVIAPAINTQIIISRTAVPLTQLTDYEENSEFPAISFENALDKLTYIAQMALSYITRSLKFPISDTGYNATLPNSTMRANTLFGWDNNGNPTAVNYIPGSPTDMFIQAGTGAISRQYQGKVREVFSVKDFGAVGDGVVNDNQAFINAAAYITEIGGGTLIIPPGTYVVGSQIFAGATGLSYAYLGTTPLTFSNCTKPVVIQGHGAILKMSSGIRFGSFNPVTGAPIATTPPYTVLDSRAIPGNIFAFLECETVEVSNLTIDCNIQGAIIGGQYGDIGYQLPYDAVYIRNTKHTKLSNVVAKYAGRDGFQIANYNGEIDNMDYVVLMENCSSIGNARQGLSWTGGNGLTALNCQFNDTGKIFNTGTGAAFKNNPGAGLDIEPDTGYTARNGVFINCEFSNNSDAGIAGPAGMNVDNIQFIRCRIIGTTNYSLYLAHKGYTFDNCLIVGAMAVTYVALDPTAANKFYRCKLTNNAAESPTGTVYTAADSDVSLANYTQFDQCIFESQLYTATNSTIKYIDCTFNRLKPTSNYQSGEFMGITRITNAGGELFDAAYQTMRGEILYNGTIIPLTEVTTRMMYIKAIDSTSIRRIFFAFADPGTLSYPSLIGDVAFRLGVTPGGFVGWVCTATGTPGTWKTFGAISA